MGSKSNTYPVEKIRKIKNFFHRNNSYSGTAVQLYEWLVLNCTNALA